MKTDMNSLWEKNINKFTISGLEKNTNIIEFKSTEKLSPKLRLSIERAKVASTKNHSSKGNDLDHKLYEVYQSRNSKLPDLFIVFGSITAINYTIVTLIGILPRGKRFKTKTLIGD